MIQDTSQQLRDLRSICQARYSWRCGELYSWMVGKLDKIIATLPAPTPKSESSLVGLLIRSQLQICCELCLLRKHCRLCADIQRALTEFRGEDAAINPRMAGNPNHGVNRMAKQKDDEKQNDNKSEKEKGGKGK